MKVYNIASKSIDQSVSSRKRVDLYLDFLKRSSTAGRLRRC